jgi:hypothetical protein
MSSGSEGIHDATARMDDGSNQTAEKTTTETEERREK